MDVFGARCAIWVEDDSEAVALSKYDAPTVLSTVIEGHTEGRLMTGDLTLVVALLSICSCKQEM